MVDYYQRRIEEEARLEHTRTHSRDFDSAAMHLTKRAASVASTVSSIRCWCA